MQSACGGLGKRGNCTLLAGESFRGGDVTQAQPGRNGGSSAVGAGGLLGKFFLQN